MPETKEARKSRRVDPGTPDELALSEAKSIVQRWREDGQALKVQAEEDKKAGLDDTSVDEMRRANHCEKVARILALGVKVREGEMAAEKAKAASAAAAQAR